MLVTDALKACVIELERLRDVHLPQYDGKVGEPDKDVIFKAREALRHACDRG